MATEARKQPKSAVNFRHKREAVGQAPPRAIPDRETGARSRGSFGSLGRDQTFSQELPLTGAIPENGCRRARK
jgi:hypothetical protein